MKEKTACVLFFSHQFSARKALENRINVDHDRCGELEQKLREAQGLLAETENKSDEVVLLYLCFTFFFSTNRFPSKY